MHQVHLSTWRYGIATAAVTVVLTACSSNLATTPNHQMPESVVVDHAVNIATTTIAYYRFETGPAGGKATTIVDSSPSRLNGTILTGGPKFSATVPVSIVPATDASDKFSLSLGVGDSGKFSYKFPFQTLVNATLELWVKSNQLGREGDIFWTSTAVGSGDANRFNIGISPTGHAFIDYREPGGALHQLGTSSVVIPSSQWSFIAYEKKGNVYLIYVNNSATSHVTKLTSSITDTSPHLPTSAGWTINGRTVMQPLGCCQFSGLLDEVRLSNQALSTSSFLVTPDMP
jgi:hypothetical protein